MADRGRPKLRYLKPADDSSVFTLPDNETILRDFKSIGGSFSRFLQQYCPDEKKRMAFAADVIDQIANSKEDQDEFQRIRVRAEQAEALLARDSLITLSKIDGPSQIQALKLVQAFTKDHVGKIREAIDDHLEDIEDDEAES